MKNKKINQVMYLFIQRPVYILEILTRDLLKINLDNFFKNMESYNIAILFINHSLLPKIILNRLKCQEDMVLPNIKSQKNQLKQEIN